MLRRPIDECERFAALRKIQSGSAIKARSCQCAGRQPPVSDCEGSLLVVQSLTSLKALRAALQPICGNSLTGASETVLSATSSECSQNKLLGNNEDTRHSCSSEKCS